MKIKVEARVIHTCYLSLEDEQTVRNYVKENGGDFRTAVWECYCNNEISLYYNSTESEFSTEDILSVEE